MDLTILKKKLARTERQKDKLEVYLMNFLGRFFMHGSSGQVQPMDFTAPLVQTITRWHLLWGRQNSSSEKVPLMGLILLRLKSKDHKTLKLRTALPQTDAILSWFGKIM